MRSLPQILPNGFNTQGFRPLHILRIAATALAALFMSLQPTKTRFLLERGHGGTGYPDACILRLHDWNHQEQY